MNVSFFIAIYALVVRSVLGKYVEGHLKTLDVSFSNNVTLKIPLC